MGERMDYYNTERRYSRTDCLAPLTHLETPLSRGWGSEVQEVNTAQLSGAPLPVSINAETVDAFTEDK